jgi:hypothetical protein
MPVAVLFCAWMLSLVLSPHIHKDLCVSQDCNEGYRKSNRGCCSKFDVSLRSPAIRRIRCYDNHKEQNHHCGLLQRWKGGDEWFHVPGFLKMMSVGIHFLLLVDMLWVIQSTVKSLDCILY